METQNDNSGPASLAIQEWCRRVPMSRSKFYELDEGLRPKMVRLGKMQRVIESPREYLFRIAADQAA